MNAFDLFTRMKCYNRKAEIIFDEEEPIGMPTDLVMPRRRWFRHKLPVPGSLEAKILEASRLHRS